MIHTCHCFILLFQAITPPTRPPSTTSEILTTKADAEVGEEQEGDMRGTLPGDFVTTAQPPSDFSSDNMGASEPEPVASAGASGTNPKSNLAAQPDSYSMFQHLMEAQVFSIIDDCLLLKSTDTQLNFWPGVLDPAIRGGATASEDA